MSRNTVQREWTSRERSWASRIVDVVATDNSGVWNTWLHKECGLSERIIQDIMPLAVEIAADRFPDKRLYVDDEFYIITDEEDIAARVCLNRLKKLCTVAKRNMLEADCLSDSVESDILRSLFTRINGEFARPEVARAFQKLFDTHLPAEV